MARAAVADNAFALRLLDWYWINGSRDPVTSWDDPTLHGKVAVLLNGQDIAGCEDASTDYGLNQSAVALLRSVILPHTPGQELPLFPHGCTILGTCSNCIIDFRVDHQEGGRTNLSRFHVTGGREGAARDRFSTVEIKLDRKDYAREVLHFAKEILDVLPERHGEAYEVDLYVGLRGVHSRLIGDVARLALSGIVDEDMLAEARGAGQWLIE